MEKDTNIRKIALIMRLQRILKKTMDAPIVLVKVDGRLRELHKQLKKDCELEFVTTEDEIGHKNVSEGVFLFCW